MVPLFSLFLFLSSSFIGKGVTNFRRSLVTSKISRLSCQGINWKKGRSVRKKTWAKDVAIKSAIILIPGKRDRGERSQLGWAKKKAKSKQHYGPPATTRMDWIRVNININSNNGQRSWIHAVLNEHNGSGSERYFIHFPLFDILSYPD